MEILREYDLLTVPSSWGPGPAVDIVANDGQLAIAEIPLSFLQSSLTNAWWYIIEVVQMLVTEPGRILHDSGQPVVPADIPLAGTYRFETLSGPCTSSSERLYEPC